jgi:uncharacterized protein (TIGR02246 family)
MSNYRAVLVAGVAVSGICLALRGEPREATGQPPTTPQNAEVKERQPDRDSVQKALDSFVAAFSSGDAKAVASHFTADGEYVSDDGTTFRGRSSLEKDYADFFTKNPGHSLAVEVETIRFPSRDTAVVDGHFKLRKDKGGELVVSRCSFLYAREDGKWQIAIAREWPSDGLTLRDLEWLIGTWEAKREGVVVSTKYEWTANKSFIRCQFSVTESGRSATGMQMIGKDPATGALRVWTFEDSGGIGDTDISRDGKKWIHTARGVTADGQILTATNILTPIDADSFTWQAVERTLNDEPLAAQPPVKVTRVKGK